MEALPKPINKAFPSAKEFTTQETLDSNLITACCWIETSPHPQTHTSHTDAASTGTPLRSAACSIQQVTKHANRPVGTRILVTGGDLRAQAWAIPVVDKKQIDRRARTHRSRFQSRACRKTGSTETLCPRQTHCSRRPITRLACSLRVWHSAHLTPHRSTGDQIR